ncbi:hypothetical protein C8R46DRAFT_1215618 [Mycena filopes]|nr:hypothetical protein C8R46DRAFT_1215618 [Mycena filopes]
MYSANASTTSLVSNNTVCSRAPLAGSAPKKDFQAAFASLQSTYGVLPPAVRASTPSTKDFKSAFADLQSTYGFGGAAPLPVAKKESTRTAK